MVKNKYRATSKSKGAFLCTFVATLCLTNCKRYYASLDTYNSQQKKKTKQKLHSHSEAMENPRLGLTALISKNQIQTSTYGYNACK